jgi:16S rRNA (cytosine1402-N4)-methyltransferase
LNVLLLLNFLTYVFFNSESVTAKDVINKLDQDSLEKIIWKYGEERLYKKIAEGIVYFRSANGPIETTQQLASLISSIVKKYFVLS